MFLEIGFASLYRMLSNSSAGILLSFFCAVLSIFSTSAAAINLVIPGSAVTASSYDVRCNCDPAKTVDRDNSTRWSAHGDGAYITLDLGSLQKVTYVKIAWYEGSKRNSLFDVLAAESSTGPWTYLLASKTSSGNTSGLEQYDFQDTNARYIRIIGHGNSSGNGWNSIWEAQVHGNSITQVALPQLVPPGSAYPSVTSVSLASATRGAEIRYTTDGSKPTATQGTVYVAPILIDKTTTLKAIAYKAGATDSTVASATYTIGDSSGGETNLDPAAPPSKNFDLSQWKLTLPSGREVDVLSLNRSYTLADVFYSNPATGGLVFRCPNLAGSTANSNYSRTELREMLDTSVGTTELGNNWVLSTSSSSAKAAAGGVNGSMKANLSVDRVSISGDAMKVGRVIVGQIHGPDSEVIRLYYHKRPSDSKGAIYFAHDTPSNKTTYYPVIGDPGQLDPDEGIALGERWDYEINVVDQQMTVKVKPEGRPTVTKVFMIESGYNDLYLYYKAGVYNQNNTGDSSDYVQATFYSLTHTHP